MTRLSLSPALNYTKGDALPRVEPSWLTAGAADEYGVYLLDTGHIEEAERLFSEATEIHQRVVGVDHANYINSLTNLWIARRNLGRREEADHELRAIREHLDPPTPMTRDTALRIDRELGVG